MSKHEKFALGIMIIAIFVLFLSSKPVVSVEVKGILQGVGTSLLTGDVLLFVAGIKNREVEELKAALDSYQEVIEELFKLTSAYSVFYHQTYRNKIWRYSLEEYINIFRPLYHAAKDAYCGLENLAFDKLNKEDRQRIGSFVPKIKETADSTWEILTGYLEIDSKTIEGIVWDKLLMTDSEKKPFDFITSLKNEYDDLCYEAMQIHYSLYSSKEEFHKKLLHTLMSYI